jgi:hypothetical protein
MPGKRMRISSTSAGPLQPHIPGTPINATPACASQLEPAIAAYRTPCRSAVSCPAYQAPLLLRSEPALHFLGASLLITNTAPRLWQTARKVDNKNEKSASPDAELLMLWL